MRDPGPLPADVLPAGTRPFRPDDGDAIEAAFQDNLARGELEGIDRHWITESVARLRQEPWLAVVAEDEGRVAGWVVPHHDDLSVALPYRRRGHGRRLVEAGRVLAAHLGLPHLRLWVPRRAADEAFATACGLRYHSSLWQLVLDPVAGTAAPAFPDDVVIRWVEPGTDEPAFAALVNEIFLDHPSPLTVDEETLRRVHLAPGFDPSTILLVAPAADRDRLIGFCRVGRHPDDAGAMVGDVKLLGVRREARGRGLARQLVRWGVDDLRRRGVDRTTISVEGENERALGLYVAEGFRPHLEWPHWVAPAVR